jgi:sugar phosphate isomerase/epimerase
MQRMNRRTFIGTSAAATITAAATRSWAADSAHSISRIGVQLYTVRDVMKTDFEGTIAKVAAAGYKEVEFAGYFDHSPKDVRAILDKNGLTAPSCHVPYSTVEKSWPEALDAAHVIGHKLIVNPWIEVEQRNSPDGWKRAAELFNKAGEAAKKAGIQFAYHNHTFEFQPAESLGGKLPYDYLLATCDKNLVKMELDLCWISVAAKDPITYFNQNPGRFPAVHVKDIKRLPDPKDAPTASPDKEASFLTEVGSGIIPWKDLFANAGKAGIKYYFVEHDNPSDSIASIKQSYNFLHSLTY